MRYAEVLILFPGKLINLRGRTRKLYALIWLLIAVFHIIVEEAKKKHENLNQGAASR